jgi:hypothetical protein
VSTEVRQITLENVLEVVGIRFQEMIGRPINDIELKILMGVWVGKGYIEIAQSVNRQESYIRTTGSKLLQTLSEIFDPPYPFAKSRFKSQITALLSPARSEGTEDRLGDFWSLSKPPSPKIFVGRNDEFQHLGGLIQTNQVVSVVGLQGAGKSALAAKLVESIGNTCWQNLGHSPSLGDWLPTLLRQLIVGETFGGTIEAQQSTLLQVLRGRRLVLVLDQMDGLFQGPNRIDYLNFIKYLSSQSHSSCVLVTHRDVASDLAELQLKHVPYSCFRVGELPMSDCQTLLSSLGINGDDSSLREVASAADQNPLVLIDLAKTITDFYTGEAPTYLKSHQKISNFLLYKIYHRYVSSESPLSDEQKKVCLLVAESTKKMGFQPKFIELFPFLRSQSNLRESEINAALRVLNDLGLIQLQQTQPVTVKISERAVFYLLFDGIIRR